MPFPEKNFEFDIFISYSHEDNLSVLHNSPGWVEVFTIALQTEFRRLNFSVRVWWDTDLHAGKLFDLTIQDKIDSSVLFICLNSANYARSSYCADEVNLFIKKCRTERISAKFRDYYRILNVLLSDVDKSHWRTELKKVHAFEFFQNNREFPLNPGSVEFTQKVQELALAIKKILQAFTTEWQTREEKPVVFVGDVNDTLITQKNKLVQTLDYLSYPVVTSIPPPFESMQHKKEVAENLTYCDFAIHMFNEYHTREVEGDEGNFYCTSQLALATACGLDQLVWFPSYAGDIKTPAYQTIINTLSIGKRENDKLQFIRSLEADFINTTAPAKIRSFEERRNVHADPNAIFLDCHPKDLQMGATLSDVVKENGFAPLISAEAAHMDETLYKVSFVTFVFGDRAADWIKRHMELVFKHPNRKIRELSIFSEKKPKGFSRDLGLRQYIPVKEFTDFDSYRYYLSTLKAQT